MQSATLRRNNMNRDFVPDWPNVDLGPVENERFGQRILRMAASIGRMSRHRGLLQRSEVVVARNFDMLVIAWASRLIAGAGNKPLVYECLDIHGLFTRTDRVGSLMRWCERRLLGKCALVIVSSPGFVREYFVPVQSFTGPFALLENKLWFDEQPVPRPDGPRHRASGEPLTLGWVGSLRCNESLEILLEVADRMGPDLRVRFFGNVHSHALPDFDVRIARHPNVEYCGPYAYPQGLAMAYGACDLVWAQDLWQRGANSDWLLPNRIYEASWFGCPSIAVADTETGRRIAADRLGFVVGAPTADELHQLLLSLDEPTIAGRAAELLARPEGDFRLTAEEVTDALAPVLPARS